MPYGLAAVHAELYEALADAVRVLETHDLPYSLMCGSLLGAVRHQAIIPWDDDVDLVLPRESYDRFEALYPAECGLGFTLDLSDTWVPRVRSVVISWVSIFGFSFFMRLAPRLPWLVHSWPAPRLLQPAGTRCCRTCVPGRFL